MSRSQNGWSALTSASPRLVRFRWITGKVRYRHVHAILDHLCARFNAEVETINVAWSWGYAPRNVRGSSVTVSNHASATAIDLNAPAHPLGKRGTFSTRQVSTIRDILDDLDGVIRWGGDYRSRADEMHFEIVGTPAQVKAAAKALKTAAEAPAKTKTVLTISLAVLKKQAKAKRPVARGSVRRYQKALNVVADANLIADGIWGPKTTRACQRWQKTSGFNPTGTPGTGSLRALCKRHGRYRPTK